MGLQQRTKQGACLSAGVRSLTFLDHLLSGALLSVVVAAAAAAAAVHS